MYKSRAVRDKKGKVIHEVSHVVLPVEFDFITGSNHAGICYASAYVVQCVLLPLCRSFSPRTCPIAGSNQTGDGLAIPGSLVRNSSISSDRR